MIINYILRFAKPFLLSLKLSGSLWHCEDGWEDERDGCASEIEFKRFEIS
jgi:hypothetical protein